MSRPATMCLLSAMTGMALQAQTFTTLVKFDGTNGARPGYGSLVQGIDGNFYGTTDLGGSLNAGTVFVMTPQGQLDTLDSFDGTDGGNGYSGLMLMPDGTFYGTSEQGDISWSVFQVTPSGALTTVYENDDYYGSTPYAGLVEGFNGMFYGTTSAGGVNGYGTIFQITSRGFLTTLHNFSGTDGASPIATLFQATNGLLYGTTQFGGTYSCGTVYSISLSGVFTTLYSFDCNGPNGYEPIGGLVEGNDGNFYGTTQLSEPDLYGLGTVFKITPSGVLTTLHTFDGMDGSEPVGGLALGSDGNFYGTTTDYGDSYGGTIFQITPAGALTTLHDFDAADGADPQAALVQGTDGSFYGTTSNARPNHDGAVFRLSVGLSPIVRTVPGFGKVGESILILGTDLTGSTSVTFNGTPATFSVLSPTAMRVTVPPGATTGTVQVVTPSDALLSNVRFLVR